MQKKAIVEEIPVESEHDVSESLEESIGQISGCEEYCFDVWLGEEDQQFNHVE